GPTALSQTWLSPSTRSGASRACRSWPTPSRTPAAPTRPSSTTAAGRARTRAAAGWWTSCWGGSDAVTEAEWASQRHLEAMLKHVRERLSGRKLRLFACACARRAEGCFRLPTTAMALAVAEGIAEGTESLEVLRDAHAIALEKSIGSGHAVAAEAGLAVSLLLARPLDAAREASREALHVIAPSGSPGGRQRRSAEAEHQRRLLRCVAGNPFRPVVIEPSWRAAHDGAAWRIARAVHD